MRVVNVCEHVGFALSAARYMECHFLNAHWTECEMPKERETKSEKERKRERERLVYCGMEAFRFDENIQTNSYARDSHSHGQSVKEQKPRLLATRDTTSLNWFVRFFCVLLAFSNAIASIYTYTSNVCVRSLKCAINSTTKSICFSLKYKVRHVPNGKIGDCKRSQLFRTRFERLKYRRPKSKSECERKNIDRQNHKLNIESSIRSVGRSRKPKEGKRNIKSTDTIISCINGINMKMVNQLSAGMMQDQRTRTKSENRQRTPQREKMRKERNETKKKHTQKNRNDYN